jgi:hypothetical protein
MAKPSLLNGTVWRAYSRVRDYDTSTGMTYPCHIRGCCLSPAEKMNQSAADQAGDTCVRLHGAWSMLIQFYSGSRSETTNRSMRDIIYFGALVSFRTQLGAFDTAHPNYTHM